MHVVCVCKRPFYIDVTKKSPFHLSLRIASRNGCVCSFRFAKFVRFVCFASVEGDFCIDGRKKREQRIYYFGLPFVPSNSKYITERPLLYQRGSRRVLGNPNIRIASVSC
uniref:AlNc14C86G5513 protein n=1 Tax=Albugo laibachii Nc14 TaxID=890382 RepID=F0WFY0_9STRA|nr:AlNc14C86G5513 [Albugo laibachii Nc14]|eukprot:CCA20114.1 AlNc14C86G5513 [Albugo laibachii Nc14]